MFALLSRLERIPASIMTGHPGRDDTVCLLLVALLQNRAVFVVYCSKINRNDEREVQRRKVAH
jgi:hypothetical protein